LLCGVPDELWQAAIQAAPLRRMDMKHAGVFLPEKFDTCLKGGHVARTIQGVQYLFGAPEITARLGNGYRMLVCFDPSDPWRGAELFNLEQGTRNVLALPIGAHLGTAEWSEPAPQFGLGAAETREQRKRFTRAFRSVYFAAGLAGSRGRRILEERDGTGGLRRENVKGAFDVQTPEAGKQKSDVRCHRSGVSNQEPSTKNEERTLSVFALATPAFDSLSESDLDATDAAGAAALEELSELAFH